MNNRIKSRRLFFALWPGEQTRQAILETLSQLPQQSKARAIAPPNLHITLHFVGQVSAEVEDCMHIAASSINSTAFEMDMDCLGHFSKAKIFWMGCQKPPIVLTQLHKELGKALGECGHQCDERIYSPHLTLMRKCDKSDYRKLIANQPHFSIPWVVEEFVLVESLIDQQGANYRVIEQYSLS
jgi:2'-5' RNA ligase